MTINLDVDKDVTSILQEAGWAMKKKRFTESEDVNAMGRIGSVSEAESTINYGYISPTPLTQAQLTKEGWKLSGDRSAIFLESDDVRLHDHIGDADFTTVGSRVYEVIEIMAQPSFGGLTSTYTYCQLSFVEEIE